MEKMGSKIKIKIVSVIMLVIMLTLQITPVALIAAPGSMNFSGGGTLHTPVYDRYYQYSAGMYTQANLGGSIAYCMDYGRLLPSGTMSFWRDLSPQGNAVLMNGYPNVGAGALGVNDSNEAHFATQMALWIVSQATFQNPNSIMNFDFEMLSGNAGYEGAAARSIAAAKKLVAKAMANPYNPSASLTISSGTAKLTNVDGKIIAGPYTAVSSATKQVNATLSNAPKSATITDVSGNVKNSFAIGEKMYVRLDENERASTLKLNLTAEGITKKGAIYTNGINTRQNYATLLEEPVSLNANIDVKWNSLLGNIELLKVDQNNQKIRGAKFDLMDSKGTKIDSAISDNQGVVRFANVTKGNYTLIETYTPEGYILDDKPISVEVKTGETFKLTVVNKKMYGELNINKKDENGTPLAGVTFEILDSAKKVIKTVTTNAQGKAIADGLKEGTYYYKEVSAPDYVVIDKTEYEFKINGNTVVKEIVNKLIKGQLEIIKVDESSNPIEGVTFEILDKNKNVIDTIVTNKEGIAKGKPIVKGDYFYRETKAPNNVIIDKKEYPFTVSENGQVVIKNIVNKIVKGSLKIEKVDEYAQPLKGVTFEILDSNRKTVDKITTNDSGIAVSKFLPQGKYYYKEVSAPAHVIIDKTEYDFVLEKDGDLIVKNIVNKLMKGKIEIIKTDDAGNTIEGVRFDILNNNKEVVDTITTGKDGKAITKDLVKGIYYYKEVSAPEEFIMDTKEYKIEIKTNGEIVIKTVVNQRLAGGLKILKLDKDTKQPIAGVKFDVLNQNKEVIQTITTNEAGIAVAEKLTKGKYYYKEVSAPDKYIVDSKEYEFEIKKESQKVEKTVYNESKKLPVTGGFISTDMIIVMVVTLVTVLGYVGLNMFLNKRKEEGNA